MSKEASYVVELERVQKSVLDRSIRALVRETDVELLNTKVFEIYSGKKIKVKGQCIKIPGCMYPVDVYVDEKNKLVVNGDEMDLRRASGKISQFYKGVSFAMIMDQEIKYDQKSRKIKLTLPRV